MSAKFQARLRLKIKRHYNKWARLFGATPCEHYLINEREVLIRHRATRADKEAIHQCLLQRQYKIPPVRGALGRSSDNFYEAVLSANKKPLIIDAGANIGASVIWFATRYPGAHIVAVEPAPNNCDLLIYNTRSYDVEVRRAGLAKSVGVATLTDPGYGEWAYRTETSGEGISVPMTTLDDIILEKDPVIYVPFILKVDIEGSESNMFDGENNVAKIFPIIIMETHDWMLPREGTSQSFFRFHLENRRDFMSQGENIFSIDYEILLRRSR